MMCVKQAKRLPTALLFTSLLLTSSFAGESAPGPAQRSEGFSVGVATVPVAHPLNEKVSLSVSSVTFQSFLDAVSKQTKLEFILLQGLDQCIVSGFLRELSAREILQMTTEVGGLTYQSAGRSNRYVIARRKAGPACPPKNQSTPAGSCTETEGRPISIKCTEGTVSSLAELLHRQSGANFLVWNEAVNHPASIMLKKIKLENAIKQVGEDRSLAIRQIGTNARYVITVAKPELIDTPAEEERRSLQVTGPRRNEPPANPAFEPEATGAHRPKFQSREYWYTAYQKDGLLLDTYLRGMGEGFSLGIQGHPAHRLGYQTEFSTVAARINGYLSGYQEGLGLYRELSGNTTGYRWPR